MDLQDLIGALVEVTGIEDPVNSTDTLQSLDVDSIQMLEWLYTLDERFALDLDLDDEDLFEGILELSLFTIHERLSTLKPPIS